MNISPINTNNTNFGLTIPVRRIVSGTNTELISELQYRGPLNALITKIKNSPSSKEAKFFNRCFKFLAKDPEISHSSLGNSGPYIFFGDADVSMVRELGKDVGRGDISRSEAAAIIRKNLLEPQNNKYRYSRYPNDKIGDPIAITLYPNKIKAPGKSSPTYNFGIDVTDISGKRVYAVLPSEIPEVAKIQAKLKNTDRVEISKPYTPPNKVTKKVWVQGEFDFARAIDRFNLS